MSGECVVKINNIISEDRSYLYEGLTLTESKSVKLWENAGRKLYEFALSPEQIQQLFQNIEQSTTAAGNNRTTIGQGKDVADAVNKAWKDLKGKVQNSGPVQDIDAKYDQAAAKLKQATGGDAGVMKYVQKYRDFAKKHPIAQSLIYAALIAAAGISGAGVGGAAALGLLKMTDKLLQGEKFSSAAYAGAKTGAMAYGAGQIGKALQGTPGSVDNISWSKNGIPFSAQVDHGKVVGDIVMAGQTINPTDPNYAVAAKEFLKAAGKEGMLGAAKNVGNANFSEFTESKYIDRQSTVRMWALNESLGRPYGGMQLTNEGVMDAIKGAASKAGQWAQTKGKNLTTRVTADKLQSAWKKAGSPMDSEDLAKVFKNAGVPEDMVKQVYTDMKVPLPGSPKEAPPVNTSTGAPQSTPPADPAVTGPAPKPTPVDANGKPDYSGGQKSINPTVKYNQPTQVATPPENNPAAPTPANNPAAPAPTPGSNPAKGQTKPSLWNKIKGAFSGGDTSDLAKDVLPVWNKFLQQYLAGYGNDPANIPIAAKAFATKNYPEAGKAEIDAGVESVTDAKTAEAYIMKLANRALANYKAGISPDKQDAGAQATADKTQPQNQPADSTQVQQAPQNAQAPDPKDPNYDEVTGEITPAGQAKKAADDAKHAELMKTNPKYAELMKKYADEPEATTPPTKTHTGGKVKGQVSQTPDAIRQRNARAAKAGTAPAAGGAGAFGQIANQLGGTQPNTMANAPVSKVNVASPNNPNQPQATGVATTAPVAPASTATTPAKVRPKYGQAPAKVTGATQPGAPTPEEQAVLQQKIAAAQAAGGGTVQESVDLAEVLWRKMKRSQ